MLKVLIIDDQLLYRKPARAAIESAVKDVSVFETDAYVQALKYDEDMDLVVLDNLNGGESYWDELLCSLREHYRQATILLVSAYSEIELQRRLATFKPETRDLMSRDPLVEFLPKVQQGITEHYNLLGDYAKRLSEKKNNAGHLDSLVFEAALEAARKIWFSPLSSLFQRVRRRSPDKVVSAIEQEFKEDTFQMDVVAERILHKRLVPFLHMYQVVICTEEAGLHNRLYHRIQSPDFFVFSDPFDGSTRFKETKDDLLKEQPQARHPGNRKTYQTLYDVIQSGAFAKVWRCGHLSLNAPVISITVAERHRVLSTVLINLITGDVWRANSAGAFFRNCHDLLATRSSRSFQAEVKKKTLLPGEDETGWQKVTLRHGVSPSNDSGRLFLCQMQARDLAMKKQRKWINSHFSGCISKYIPWSYDVMQSYLHRVEQRDFSPGPGRILFLMDSDATSNYERISLKGQRYDMVLSAGEPITEWIGWFAFLRKATSVKVYCLRAESDPEVCTHKRLPGDVCVALPSEANSIFKKGYMDLYVLQAGLGPRMREYKDTLAIIFNDDNGWSEQPGQMGLFGRQDFVEIQCL